MARGKHAASAAKARAEQAEEVLAALKAKNAEERASWVRERADLLNEVQRLTNRLVSEVKDLADHEVQAARAAAMEEVRVAREDFKKRAEQAVTILNNIPGESLRPDFIADIADLLGVSMGLSAASRVIGKGMLADNRRTRRTVAHMSANKHANIARESAREADVWAGFGEHERKRDE